FQGTIAVDNAEINGRFEGELTVRKQLTIHGTGKVSGKIRYAKIKIEEGAELAGEISVLDKSQASLGATKRVGAALTNQFAGRRRRASSRRGDRKSTRLNSSH